MAGETYQGSSLASWWELQAMLGGFALVVVLLAAFGRPDPALAGFERFLARIPASLERLTGGAGWAVATVAMAWFGLLVAGQGFYSDVAWHVALGRDDELLTAPHTAIVAGLVMFLGAGLVGILFATVTRADVGLRWGGLRVPWSTLPLVALGAAAVAGFPLDEVWHGEYGIDVTMWSPTHMLMILGASFVGLAGWLVLAEAGIGPGDSWKARGAHVLALVLALLGLSASQGEFVFGVPQFQAMFMPVLVSLAAGFALTAGRLVLGGWWTLGATVALAVLNPAGGDSGPVDTRRGALYVGSALWVELVAAVLGTERRLRFAVVSGLGIGTVGLAVEWWWNQGAYQPWEPSMLPDAVVLATGAAIAAAIAGVAFGAAVRREPAARSSAIDARWLIGAGIAVLVVLALPMPRHVGDLRADVTLDRIGAGERAFVEVAVEPDEVADARWFQVMTWQGGGLTISDLQEVESGRYRSEHAHQITGLAKTVVRVHRGSEMMAVPVYLPEDPEIGEALVPAVDRVDTPFVDERDLLMREATDGDPWYARAIFVALALAVAAWVGAFTTAAWALRRPDPEPAPAPPRAATGSSS